MALPLSSAFTAWKNEESQTDPVAILYDISIDATTTLRLVEGNPNSGAPIVFNSETYLPAAIRREDVSENIEGDILAIRVAVSNIDGVAGGYIEQFDLEGRSVTITAVLLSSLAVADSISETYTIQDQTYNREQAVFVLSNANFFKKRIPTRQFLRNKCRWDYENRFTVGHGCAYPSDEFSADSRQNLIVGNTTDSELARLWGWSTINSTKVSALDMDLSVPDSLYMETSSTNIDWLPGDLSAPFLFKKISGDFDVNTQIFILDTRVGSIACVLCQESAAGLDSWICCGIGTDTDENQTFVVRAAQDGVEEVLTTTTTTDTLVRLERVGTTFTVYTAPDLDTAWAQQAQYTLNLDQDVRLGLGLIAPSIQSAQISAAFPYFRFDAGGLPTCDRTLDGADGCRAHGNVRRIFLFRGIPQI